MTQEILPFERLNVRGTDSNSLLRMYDQATGFFSKSTSPRERSIAERAIQRISKELKKREVTFLGSD